jgi:DNA-binding response OmpR family regulator
MSPEQAVCPCCGYNLRRDERVDHGRFSHAPNTGAFVDGARLRLHPAAEMIFGALIRARGRALTIDALKGVTGSEDALGNTPKVHICHIRRACAAVGAPDPIETLAGRGYRWAPPAA